MGSHQEKNLSMTNEMSQQYSWVTNGRQVPIRLCLKKYNKEEITEGQICNRKIATSKVMALFDPIGFQLRLQLAGEGDTASDCF